MHAWLDRCDQNAAQWLVTNYQPTVWRIVARWLPHHEMVNDVVQETFIKAFGAMHSLDPIGNFAPWLYAIARNTSANQLRTLKRNIVKPAADYGIDNLNDMLIAEDPPLSDVDHRSHSIEELLSQLQHKDRVLLTLIHLEGRSTSDVGQRLGLSEGNVRIRLMRSHRTLRKQAARLRAAGRL
jgi:RNA polymerase sigma-70 factor, ECF subfamily